jgi:hypothetical protein
MYVPLAVSRTVLPLSQPTHTLPAACWPHPAGRLRTPDNQAASDAKGKAYDVPHTPYYCVLCSYGISPRSIRSSLFVLRKSHWLHNHCCASTPRPAITRFRSVVSSTFCRSLCSINLLVRTGVQVRTPVGCATALFSANPQHALATMRPSSLPATLSASQRSALSYLSRVSGTYHYVKRAPE